jgi:glycosidase
MEKNKKKIPQSIYHIFVDRFSTGNEEKDNDLSLKHTTKELDDYSQSFLGGNLKGIIKRFDYIKSLGVDAVWISPFYKTSAYHGYHITDFFSIDERFGNSEDLKKIVEIAHENNIKVFLDFIPNHCSKQHPFFLDSQENSKSKYREWFVYKRWPNKYLCFLHFSELPKLNLYNKDCRQYIIEVAKYWIKEFDIDGYRIDHAIGPPVFFWEELKKETQKIKEEFILIPEIWFSGVEWKHLKTFYFLHKENKKIDLFLLLKILFSSNHKKQDIVYRYLMPYFDAIFDFTLSEFLRENHQKSEKVKKFSKDRNNLFNNKDGYVFLDNHDMSRFTFLCNNDVEKYRKGINLLFSLEKPVVIYYGNEIGLEQKNHLDQKSHQDKEFRRFMKWGFNEEEEDIFNFIKKRLRKKEKK